MSFAAILRVIGAILSLLAAAPAFAAPADMRELRSFVLARPAGVTPAQGHSFWFGSARPVTAPVLGAGSAPQGGLHASADDLGRVLRAAMSRDPALLSAAGWAEMLRP